MITWIQTSESLLLGHGLKYEIDMVEPSNLGFCNSLETF